MQLQFEATPLWFYILREADLMADGRHLVGVGAQIVGQMILGVLQTDANSFVVAQRIWRPTLPAPFSSPDDFQMGRPSRVRRSRPGKPTPVDPMNRGGAK